MPAGNFIWSNQITFLAVTNSFQSGSGRENTVSSMDNDDSQNRKKPVFDRSQKQVSSPGDGYKKDAVVAGLHQKLYGDRIFKKTGINRDSTGKHRKTRYFSGKRYIFNRDRLASGAFFLGQLETGTSAEVGVLFSCPGRPRKGPGRRRVAGRTRGPRSPKTRLFQAIQGRRAAHPSRKSAAAADARGRASRPMVRL